MPQPVPPCRQPQKVKCRAKSKRTGNQCNSWAMDGVDLCRMHGGRSARKPATYNITHGQRSEFIRRDKLNEWLEKAQDLSTPEGRAAALRVRYAEIAARAENIPCNMEHLELALKADDRLIKNIVTQHELAENNQPATSTTFNIVQYSADGPFRRVLARGLDGPVTVQYIENEPYMFDPQVNAYFAAVRQVDEDSGAEFFTRLLEALPSVV